MSLLEHRRIAHVSRSVQRRTPVMIQRIFVVIPVQHELELDDVNSAVEGRSVERVEEETGVRSSRRCACSWQTPSQMLLDDALLQALRLDTMTISFPILLLFLNPVSLDLRTEQLQTKQARGGRSNMGGRKFINMSKNKSWWGSGSNSRA